MTMNVTPSASSISWTTDVRVFELGGSLGFLDEAPLALRVGYQVGLQYFEGDLAVELQVHGAVHDSHTAAADLFEDFVMREGLPNHEGLIFAGENSLSRVEKSKMP